MVVSGRFDELLVEARFAQEEVTGVPRARLISLSCRPLIAPIRPRPARQRDLPSPTPVVLIAGGR